MWDNYFCIGSEELAEKEDLKAGDLVSFKDVAEWSTVEEH